MQTRSKRLGKQIGLLASLMVWGALVFALSSQAYQEQTLLPLMRAHLSEPALRDWMPDVRINYSIYHFHAKQQPFLFLEFALRKAAHMFVYGVFAALAYVAVPPYRRAGGWKAFAILAFTGAVALLDEWNQSSGAGRTSSAYDVGIDLAGAALGLLAVILASRSKPSSGEG